ncbi:hypothetical protein [Streptomyces uncialis]|uniref:hypothetical protein n=1 Tax=Streptomyces uncialis TaxID=1048205 RepID=UPI0038709964|nr:hypothetical protein OG268_10135 [Streptomyces uncialis]
MGWDEWEELKARAAERQSTSMQVNHVPGDPGGTEASLEVRQSDLAKIGDHAFKLHMRLWDEARVQVASTETAGAGLKGEGFALGGALEHVSTRWEEQVRSLRDACGHISNHLEFTKKTHRGDDHRIGSALNTIETLTQGFDDRVGGPGARNPVYGTEKEKKDS